MGGSGPTASGLKKKHMVVASGVLVVPDRCVPRPSLALDVLLDPVLLNLILDAQDGMGHMQTPIPTGFGRLR